MAQLDTNERTGTEQSAQLGTVFLFANGLRCRVLVEGASGLSVVLRTQVGNVDSTLDQPRRLDDDGTVSLLAADDELEGATAAIVVLDANGDMVARRSTIVGG